MPEFSGLVFFAGHLMIRIVLLNCPVERGYTMTFKKLEQALRITRDGLNGFVFINSESLEIIEREVDGLATPIKLNDEMTMWVNAEMHSVNKLTNSSSLLSPYLKSFYNPFAQWLYQVNVVIDDDRYIYVGEYKGTDWVLGDVVITGQVSDEGEISSLTYEQQNKVFSCVSSCERFNRRVPVSAIPVM